jgi:glycosyltransferase involved in cell wall biosynthesis
MKVLHVIPSISPRRGGPGVAALEMAAALCQQGVEASLLTTNDDGPGLLADLPLGRWIDHGGVPLLAFGRWSPPIGPLREFAVAPALSQWLAAHLADYDLLHVHALFSYPSTSAMAQARQAGVPYVISTIGQLCHWSLARSSRRKRLMLGLIERRNLNGAAALHVTTAAERDQTASLGLDTGAVVIPLGVHLPTVAAAGDPAGDGVRAWAADGPTRFLFLSRIHPKKQLEQLLTALARVPGDWILQIAGEGEPAYLAALKRLADQLGIASRCQWLGFLAGEAKWQALVAADWFVLPSASENFGIAAIEALAAGLPVILSPEVAVAELLWSSGAALICSSESQALAATLERALAKPTAELRQEARRLAAERFAWPAIAGQLQSAYGEVLR